MSKKIIVCGDSPLKSYKTYLQEQGYSETTIIGNERQIEIFENGVKKSYFSNRNRLQKYLKIHQALTTKRNY